MSGTVLAMPVGNPVALGHLSRTTPDGLDSIDLNRVFPGEYSVITDQLAMTIAREILAPADAMIDFHSGFWGSAQGVIIHRAFPDPQLAEATHAMARAFGWPSIQASQLTPSLERSSTGYFGGVLGRPCITPEIGGSGFDQALEEYWIETKVKGALNVMKHLGILSGAPDVPDRYLVWSKRWRVNPKKGGLLVPVVGPDRHLTEVQKGELLGRVLSPYTFEEIERLEAPGRGVLFSFARQHPVRAGGWAFGVVDCDDPNTHWA
jgi:predicted deacylase